MDGGFPFTLNNYYSAHRTGRQGRALPENNWEHSHTLALLLASPSVLQFPRRLASVFLPRLEHYSGKEAPPEPFSAHDSRRCGRQIRCVWAAERRCAK